MRLSVLRVLREQASECTVNRPHQICIARPDRFPPHRDGNERAREKDEWVSECIKKRKGERVSDIEEEAAKMSAKRSARDKWSKMGREREGVRGKKEKSN